MTLDFWKVAVRPGKPMLFGRLDAHARAGAAGQPALLPHRGAHLPRAADLPPARPQRCAAAREPAVLAHPLEANGPRQHYMRATLAPGAAGLPPVTALTSQDSAHMSALAAADVLIVRPPNAPAAARRRDGARSSARLLKSPETRPLLRNAQRTARVRSRFVQATWKECRRAAGGPMLTEKQKELLLFIHARMQEKGVPPSFDEMKDALDLKSKSGIHRLITALVERGFIRRLPHRARAIEVIRLPENQSAPPGPKRAGFQPSVIEGSRSRDLAPPPSTVIDSRTVSVPVMGRIAAGTPISAIQNHTPRHRLPARPADQRRALRAGGEGRFDDRGRHSRRRHGHHPPLRYGRERRHRRRPGRLARRRP